MNTVKYGIYYCFNNLHNLQYAIQHVLIKLLVFSFLYGLRTFYLVNFVGIYLLFLLPKLFIYKLFQIFMNFLNHHYSFEYSRGLFFHEATN
jgi:hypothetical protein